MSPQPTDASEHRSSHLLALMLAGDTLTHDEQLEAVRAAYRWGHERGYTAGFTRSFDARPFKLRAQYEWGSEEIPSLAELRRRRGEDPDTGEPLPSDSRYLGGPVDYDGQSSSTGKETAA